MRGGEILVALERVGASRDQVVEIDEAALALLPLVVGIDGGDVGRRARCMPPRHRDRVLVVARAHHARLGPFDLGRDLRCQQTGLAASPGNHGHEETHLAFEQRRHGATLFDRAPPELSERDRVEGAGSD